MTYRSYLWHVCWRPASQTRLSRLASSGSAFPSTRDKDVIFFIIICRPREPGEASRSIVERNSVSRLQVRVDEVMTRIVFDEAALANEGKEKRTRIATYRVRLVS